MKKLFKKLLSKRASVFLIVIGISLIFFGLILFLWKENQLSPSKPISKEEFAQYGDFVGGIVGSIWALAGVILFYVALNEQRKDLRINQKALKQQIKEFKLQRKELEETKNVFNIQKFDNTFFNLLGILNDIFHSMSLDTNMVNTLGRKRNNTPQTHSGNGFFSESLIITEGWFKELPLYQNIDNRKELKLKYIEHLQKAFPGVSQDMYELLDNFLIDNSISSRYKLGFFQFYVGFHSDLDKYVSYVLQILRYLNKSSLINPDLDFSDYPEFIKAQLSNDEKLVIWLCTEIKGLDQSLFLKYDIFKGMKSKIELDDLKTVAAGSPNL